MLDKGEWQESNIPLDIVGQKIYLTNTDEYKQAKANENSNNQEQEVTVNDLAEALDILTNIVLGGGE